MKNKVLKRMLPASLAAVMIMSLGACGQKKQVEKQEMDVTIDQITLGEDYTDIEADLKFRTLWILLFRDTSKNSRKCIQMSILNMKGSRHMQMTSQLVLPQGTGEISV